MNNRSGLPFKLLLYDHHWDNILGYYTYDNAYALDIMQQKFGKKHDFSGAVTTRSKKGRDRPRQSREGQAR